MARLLRARQILSVQCDELPLLGSQNQFDDLKCCVCILNSVAHCIYLQLLPTAIIDEIYYKINVFRKRCIISRCSSVRCGLYIVYPVKYKQFRD